MNEQMNYLKVLTQVQLEINDFDKERKTQDQMIRDELARVKLLQLKLNLACETA